MKPLLIIWTARAAWFLPGTEPLFHRPFGQWRVNSAEYIRRIMETTHA